MWWVRKGGWGGGAFRARGPKFTRDCHKCFFTPNKFLARQIYIFLLVGGKLLECGMRFLLAKGEAAVTSPAVAFQGLA